METGIGHHINDLFLSKTKMHLMKDWILNELYPNPSEDEVDLIRLINIHMRRMLETIFYYAETDAEKIFLNSFFTLFVNESPYFMNFSNPLSHANEDMNRLSKSMQEMISIWKKVQKELGEIAFELLAKEINKFDTDEVTRYHTEIFAKSTIMFNYYNKFQLSMKSTFPDIEIEGQHLKADILIWLPSNPNFKLIVESDGFGSASEKSAFNNPRSRDHFLQTKGFQVIRFSGEEIISDPLSKSNDLYKYLLKQKR